jgi:hypothetical protein
MCFNAEMDDNAMITGTYLAPTETFEEHHPAGKVPGRAHTW